MRRFILATCAGLALLATTMVVGAVFTDGDDGDDALLLIDGVGPGKQGPHEFEAKVTLKYLLYLPADYGKDKEKKFPLMLFLHGSGERGSDVNAVAKHGPPKLAAAGKEFPFIIVSPQCAAGDSWEPVNLKRLIDDIESKYTVDKTRVYLTGLSMGGYGTWDMASRYPEIFAAIAPICGGGDPGRVKRMKNLPTWAFHGEDDPVVPIKASEEMVEALKKTGNPEVKFTRYPHTQHDSWVQAYDDPKLYEWLLEHKAAPPAPRKEGKKK